MNFSKNLNFYCERITDSFWAEPLNAISNLGFILVGILFLIKYKQLSKWTTFFCINSIIIGIGSFLFHTFANVWSLFADIIPIMILISCFFFYSFRVILKHSNVLSFISTVLILIIGILLENFNLGIFNGSEAYFHVLASLLFFSYGTRNKRLISKKFICASCIFMMSLVFRTVDNFACDFIPIGTHFMWHLSNSFLIYILILISFYENKK